MQPLAGDEPAAIGPYRLLGRPGAGGMGRVYLGRSAGGRTVAVKIVHPQFALGSAPRPSTGAPTTGGPAPGDGEPAPTGSPHHRKSPPPAAVPSRPATPAPGRAIPPVSAAPCPWAPCDPAPHQIELTPVGDDLKCTSESESEGHPVAELTKTG
ncbi:hypothetical protein HEP81_03370 [Streptomyces griseofuscus]|uniref:Serine/threonine protein kinase n=1 Tax=Streptomyces griseofuscus TaxID=146922 RepID=A0A7H1Q046_9ACTN|nr:hypothetical protein [Streptomyces griseofuscus]QNT93676.1 hypothetical protein HEP81_03370 [Streptomyces griseofuscus]